MKTALITGITGQDGAYLAKLLLENNYKVVGLLRNGSGSNIDKLTYLKIASKIIFDTCDLTQLDDVNKIINKYNPTEIYNLASQSSVSQSFANPIETLNFNIISVCNILESIRLLNGSIKFYQASSSEMFGRINTLPLTEQSPFSPVSPYGISKASAHWITVNYREVFGIFATSGILFNHESVLRGDNFIIKKIIKTSLDIVKGLTSTLEVGNIDIKRDFGYAPKYVEAMYSMMQGDTPNDYIISSGVSISIREIVYYVFDKLEISRKKIIINKDLFRSNEIKDIYGDSSKASEILNWNYDIDFYNVLDILIDEEVGMNEL